MPDQVPMRRSRAGSSDMPARLHEQMPCHMHYRQSYVGQEVEVSVRGPDGSGMADRY